MVAKSVLIGIQTYIYFLEKTLFCDILPWKGRIILALVSNNIGLMQKRCSINLTSFLRDFQANLPCQLKKWNPYGVKSLKLKIYFFAFHFALITFR